MTMPNEEYDTILNRVPDFIRWCITVKSKDLTVSELRRRAINAKRHYPWKHNIKECWKMREV